MAVPDLAVPSDSVTRPPGGPTLKRAARLADLIIDEVVRLGWPVGRVIGNERELLDRFGVSRAVFREAVRLVEHQGVGRTRRGPGGGLVVTDPPVLAVIDAVVFYLYRIGATLEEVLEARRVVEGIATEVAARRMDREAARDLEELVADELAISGGDPRVFHGLVAAATGNPAVELFVDVLNRVALLYAPGWKTWAEPHIQEAVHAHDRITAALLAGEGDLAGRRMLRHLEAEGALISRHHRTLQSLPRSSLDGERGSGKTAERVARHLARRVVDDSLVTGSLIGTEPELTGQEGVSRAVFREAVRILEYHHVAVMRRGPGGGLVVAEPDVGAVTGVVAVYLARQGVRPHQVDELRDGVRDAVGSAGRSRVLDLVTLVLERLCRIQPERLCRIQPVVVAAGA